MLEFKEFEKNDTKILSEYLKNCNYGLCEYSVGIILMWNHYFHFAYTVKCGCLITKTETKDISVAFAYPVPVADDADIDGALREIESYCIKNGIRLQFWIVPKNALPHIAERYPSLRISASRLWCDYIYNADDMISFSGKKYSGQRNHINKFKKLYPDYTYRSFDMSDRQKLEDFFVRFDDGFSKGTRIANDELDKSKELIFDSPLSPYKTGCIELDGEIIGICVGEICGDTLVIHIEKALHSYQGIYPTLVNEFAKANAVGLKYINREDDACDKGLRTSKTQYHPIGLGEKHFVTLFNPIDDIKEIPTIETERLTLDHITKEDAEAYFELCVDSELNKYWGYDYQDDLKGELYQNYFYDTASNDFKRRLAINLAIRLDGKFIGEAVLYSFDFRGGCELGLRIFKKYFGHGYGKEAFAAAADYALYSLGIRCLKAKCYKPNIASFNMLASCMKQTTEDDEFYHFQKVL